MCLWRAKISSSDTICTATTTCAAMISKLPSRGLLGFASEVSVSLSALMPTMAAPAVTRSIPIQWKGRRRFLSTITDSTPVNTTTLPRSIWKVDAYVMVKPKYMMLVPAMSRNAGHAKMYLGKSLFSSGSRGLHSSMSLSTIKHSISPKNMPAACTNGWSNVAQPGGQTSWDGVEFVEFAVKPAVKFVFVLAGHVSAGLSSL
mmetsp:Transcript_28205/g.57769  ORF Transcript_28205/g.57769 Transcript_28205/m.57769 type:complete len:202 (-) Transcript_28205:282-887(-)